jgi:hypothetical protein
MVYTKAQFWADSAWRALRTFCQALAALLVVVQTSSGTISIPWQTYLYSSGVAALISLLQSIDRERAVNAADPTTPATPTSAPATLLTPMEAYGPGCGGDQR